MAHVFLLVHQHGSSRFSVSVRDEVLQENKSSNALQETVTPVTLFKQSWPLPVLLYSSLSLSLSGLVWFIGV